MMFWILFAIATAMAEADTEDVVTLKKDNAECTIHLHGATIISWKVDGHEQLFLSEAAKLDGSTHIMGGVPIVFPKFADWGEKRPFHGFARVSRWRHVKNSDDSAVFELVDNDVTRGFWNHTFRLEYTVNLQPKEIKSELRIHNPVGSSSSFEFEVLYHTFIRIPDIKNITISGLKGLKYKDKIQNFAEFTEQRELVDIKNFTDSIYQSTPNVHCISNAVGNKTLVLTKSGLPDLVVWNPWSEIIKTFTDLKPYEWKNFICAEAGHVTNRVVLAPGNQYEATQTLTIN